LAVFVMEFGECHVETLVNPWTTVHGGAKARVGGASTFDDRDETRCAPVRISCVSVNAFFEHTVHDVHRRYLAGTCADDRYRCE
jgi:hypothetical protein